MPTQTELETPILGMLDDVAKGVARGWAFDRTKPDARLTVEIWEGERLVAAGEAADLRGDLRDAGLGDGRHGFTIKIPSLSVGEHPIHAKVSGNKRILGAVNVPDLEFRGSLNCAEGLAISGWVSVSTHGETAVQLIADNGLIDEVQFTDMAPDTPREFLFQLPLALADGRVHWFQLKARETGTIIAESVSIVPTVLTPEQSLQRYANDFPVHLSANAANRYAALERRLSFLASAVGKMPASDLADALRQLDIAHRQVKRGFAIQPRAVEHIQFESHERPVVSVVIPAHNHFSMTYNCLASILLAGSDASFEVIVVDDGSTDSTLPEHGFKVSS